MPRPYEPKETKYGAFNDEGLDHLHASDPHREFTLDEIAKALGTKRQTVWAIERRALRKIKAELIRRGVDSW